MRPHVYERQNTRRVRLLIEAGSTHVIVFKTETGRVASMRA